jgi:2,5-furandicarboxylate decarboxylase 1
MRTTPPADQSIRSYLDELDASGDLLRVSDPVDPAFGISALLALVDGGPAVVFDEVDGHDLRVVGNLLSTRERVGRALGVAEDDVLDALLRCVHDRRPAVLVESGPVQEVVESDVDLRALPVPRFFEKETGAYVTAGMILARDPLTGRGNASFARLRVDGPDHAFIGIAPNHHLARMARAAAEAGAGPLEAAVVIGAHPAIQLAACLYLDLGDDELDHAAALLGEPVRVVAAESLDLVVPADAELVIEGTIHVDAPIHEGLVSEFHGMYEDYGDGFTFRASCITRRSDAMFQVVQPGWFREHLYLAALPIAAGLKAHIAAVVPSVHDVAVTEGGAGRTSVVVSLRDPKPGQAKRVMFACWSAVSIVKSVTVVDADIDVWDPVQVDWARHSRVRLERDLLLVPGAGADRSEPMEAGGLVTKVGLDATATPGDRVEGFDLAVPPAAHVAAARAWLAANAPGVPVEHPWFRDPAVRG